MHIVDTKLDTNFTKLIKQAAAGLQVTSFSLYLSTLVVYLARCLNVEDVSIGIMEANRTQREDSQTIGHFLNMLPLRFQLRLDEPFSSVAKRSPDVVSMLEATRCCSSNFDLFSRGRSVPRSHSPSSSKRAHCIVVKFTDNATLPEVSISEYLPLSDSSDGYGVCKWVSEVLLEKVSADNGLPTWNHRRSSVVGDDAPALNLINVIFKYARVLGAVPKLDSENATGAFDLIVV
ncbi:hypothetical protein DL762_001884 [Monosporascus cannonballus]|uniref:Condensation domain-containing protein n=1 Tax=Monosporascus cannonballus TaxID=155416 RepID=A0ABY0HGA3_9PEZI|nr:hypothetical protein DL762_001884 [Monosporascus cannonballus]